MLCVSHVCKWLEINNVYGLWLQLASFLIGLVIMSLHNRKNMHNWLNLRNVIVSFSGTVMDYFQV